MTEARIPTPRQIARTPVIREPSAASAIGDAFNVLGQAGQQFVNEQRATDERVAEIDHRIALDEQKRQDDVLYLEKMQEFVKLEAEARRAAMDLRENADRFAKGHVEKVRDEITMRYQAFDESLGDNERVRQRLRLNVVQSAATLDAQEEVWQRKQEFKAQGEAFEYVVTTRRNELSDADPKAAGAMYGTFAEEIRKMVEAGSYNADEAVVLERAALTELALGLNEGLFNAGKPQVVQEMLDKGFFDNLDVDVAKIGDQVKAEQRALDLAAERAQAEAQVKARELARRVQELIELGVTPPQKDFDAAIAAMRAAGVPESEIIGFSGLSVQIGLNRQFSEAKDPEGIQTARYVKQLETKIANGTATPEEQIAYKHLSGVAEARAKAAGAARRDLAGQGVPGQLQVLQDLDRLPRESRFAAAEAAKDGLGYVAMLRPYSRKFALDGREARTARPKDFGTKEEVKKAFDEKIGSNIGGYLAGSYDDIMALSWDLYAGQAVSKGGSGWDPARFMQSVDVAFGARNRGGVIYGGIGTFNGHKVIVPDYVTKDQFERFVRARTFKDARYSDGSKVKPADILKYYRPEYAYDNEDHISVYYLVDASGNYLKGKSGRNYVLRVPRPKGIPR